MLASMLLVEACLFSVFGLSAASAPPADLPLITRQADWQVGQTVLTSSGPVQGHAASVNTGVSEYLGIPYAFPPVGELRFQPPLRFNGSETINGTDFGYVCMQVDMFGGFSKKRDLGERALPVTLAGLELLAEYSAGIPPINEDCLTLNVWSKPQVGEAKKAVLIWIHGGGYTSGSSAVSFYNGQHLAELDDVVIVSLNYRLNVFGFPGAEAFPATNLGLLDQRLALEWVRDNIEAFGGDPDRMVIHGQSAGGGSVAYHTYAWADDPIVQGYIIQSGVNISAQSAASANANWLRAAKLANCTGTEKAIAECMQLQVSAEDLLKIALQTGFGPSVDGTVVFDDYDTRKPADKPVVVGHNDNEPGLFKVLAPPEPDSYWESQELGFGCEAAERAAYYVLNGVPTWRYRWFGDFPNLRLTVNPTSGAWHGSEILPLFNTTPQKVVADTPAERAISTYLQGAWTTFAKDPVNGLNTYGGGWPQYSTNGSTLIRLAFNNQTGTNLAIGNAYDAKCPPVPVVTSPSPLNMTVSPTPSYSANAANRLSIPIKFGKSRLWKA